MISLDGKKVLIVEDDRWFADTLVRVLERAGVETRVAPHAAMAIELVDEFQPEAIVLDLLLSGSTGLVLLHELKSHADLATLPVVVCSTLIDDQMQQQLRAYDVVRTLDKTTMQPDDVLAALRGALG